MVKFLGVFGLKMVVGLKRLKFSHVVKDFLREKIACYDHF